MSRVIQTPNLVFSFRFLAQVANKISTLRVKVLLAGGFEGAFKIL